MQNKITVRSIFAITAAACVFFLENCPLAYPENLEADARPVSVDVIIEKLQAANLRRAEALLNYSGKRTYNLDYRGLLTSRHAEMVVEARYSSPDKKEFKIISQTGSKLLLSRALQPLLEGEKEALQEANRQQVAFSPRNYNFTLLNAEQTPEGLFYVLQVEPRIKNKFLYRGKGWVDAESFAISRIEADPAKNPSWWINRTPIKHNYTKVGEFWLPVHTSP